MSMGMDKQVGEAGEATGKAGMYEDEVGGGGHGQGGVKGGR